jgi:hypothetical protein
MILTEAKKMYKGDLEIKRAYHGSDLFWGDVSGAAVGNEWMAWDYDPFNPLLGDFLLTQVFE